VGDLSRTDQTRALVDEIVSGVGPIDILVNNAGTSWGRPRRIIRWTPEEGART